MSHPPVRFGRRALGLVLLIALAGSASAAGAQSSTGASDPAAGSAGAEAVAAGVGPVTRLPLPRFVSLRGESANARRGPSFDQRVDWEFLRRGMPLEVTAEYGNWRRVRDADGKGGWVHQALLSGTRTAVVIATEPVGLGDKAEPGARIVAVVEPGVVGRIVECVGSWCEITTGGTDGWLPRAALWGVGPDETIN